MRASRQNHLVSAALALALAATLAGCGSSSTPETPAQSETRARINTYVEAVNKIAAPFNSDPTERALQTAVAELTAVVPPAQFRTSYERFLGGLRGDLSGFKERDQGERTGNASLISGAEAKRAQEAGVASAALAEAGAELTKCRQDHYSC